MKQERGSFAGAIAMDGQGSAHLFRGERAAVQAEAVSFFAGGETMIEYSVQVLRKNSDAIVDHREIYLIVVGTHFHLQHFIDLP